MFCNRLESTPASSVSSVGRTDWPGESWLDAISNDWERCNCRAVSTQWRHTYFGVRDIPPVPVLHLYICQSTSLLIPYTTFTNQPAYSPACTDLYNLGHNISAFGSTSAYSKTSTSTPLFTKRFIHVSHASEICRILESLFIDRVGRFWVVAKICETFTCLSRQWRQRRFLEHEYIVNSSRAR